MLAEPRSVLHFGMLKLHLLLLCFLGACSSGDRSVKERNTNVSVGTKMKLIRVPLPWHRPLVRESAGERVVFLHGLWRSHHAMDDLASEFHELGYETVNIPYPSFRKSLDDIVKEVAGHLGDSQKKTHFVTHSMGGIVLRKLASNYPEKVTGRVVMLAPPNQGSEVIDWMEDCPFARWTLGPGGISLTTGEVTTVVPGFFDQREVGVIMGRDNQIRMFQSLIEGANDGVVTVKGGMVKGVSELIVVPANHTFIMASPEVKGQIASFLKKGRFNSTK
jgi:triacylglycerol lipase